MFWVELFDDSKESILNDFKNKNVLIGILCN